MTEKEKTEKRVRLIAGYKRRIKATCKFIGIDSFGHRDMLRLVNRIMLIKGDVVTYPDLQVLVRLYNRELLGRRDIPPEKQKELLT